MIRAYVPADLEAVTDIGNRAWRRIYEMYRSLYGDELFGILCPNPATRKGEEIRRHCEAHPEWAYVCEEKGVVVGFVTFSIDARTRIGEIGNNAVDPDCGLKGIGQQMYRAVLDRFREEGLAHAKVVTGLDHAHAPARRAYERAGFDIRKEDVTYYMRLAPGPGARPT